MSNRLLSRIGSFHKQARCAMEECDKVLLYPCVSVKAAIQLEKLLIARLRPRYNANGKRAYIQQMLGLKNTPHLA
jgi:hypothetical protein